MPQRPSIIATKAITGNVLIYNTEKHPAKPKDDIARPDMKLIGHQERSEGYGLCWNTKQPGLLLSGSHDKKICLWDIEKQPVVATVPGVQPGISPVS